VEENVSSGAKLPNDGLGFLHPIQSSLSRDFELQYSPKIVQAQEVAQEEKMSYFCGLPARAFET